MMIPDHCPYDGGVTMSQPQRSGPLAGLLVADFSRVLAGPYATMLMADLGAEVIKVEGPAGDDTRSWSPPVRDGVATYFLGINRNKRSIVLDLGDPDDAAVAQELARRADIVIENFKPGGLARFGLDYEAVAATNPRVVYAAISHRHETGLGQHVEVNLLSSALSGLVNQSSAYVAGGVVPHRMGNSHPSLFPYEPLPCSDRDLIVTAGNNGQFRKLVAVLGIPELADDPRFARNEDRTANRDELRPLLVQRLRTRTAMAWFDELIAAGVPCGPINSIDGGVAFAEGVGLDPVVLVGFGADAVPSVRNPIRMSQTPPDYLLPPPTLNEHGDEIRAWLDTPEEDGPA